MIQLTDKFSRQISYLRVSVTDNCNYKCFYCRDENEVGGSIRKETLTNSELIRIIDIFAQLGICKIRLTGGEPLLRKNIASLVCQIAQLKNIQDFSMSTNAHLLAKMASKLFDSGLQRLNISLDSLLPQRFADITRGGDLTQVLAGIDYANKIGFSPIKINMVVMQDVNDDEIEPMLDYAISNNLQLRFIETMPIGTSGIKATAKHYPNKKILARVEQHIQQTITVTPAQPNDGPAKVYTFGNASVGVISAISDNFCDTCNRVRLTANGDLVLCLGQADNVSLRDAMRKGKTDGEIKSIIITAIDKKPEKHFFVEDKFNVVTKKMVQMGG